MKKIAIFIVFSLLFITNVSASDYENEMFINDENITINSDINSSSLIIGDNIDVNNKIEGVGILFGNNVVLDSSVDYFATIGSNVTFNGIVKDGLILGDTIILNESSSVGRDITIFADTVSISGSISRNVRIYAKDVTIKDAQIAGNVKINYADNIKVEANAHIIGELSYNEDAITSISNVASIGNTTTYIVEVDDVNAFLEIIKNKAISLINVLVVFALSLYFAPKLFSKIELKKKDIIKNIGLGFIFLLLVPIITLMLIITVFGLSLGIILIALYLLLLYFSTIVTGYLVGNLIWDRFIKKEKLPYLIGVMGIVLLYIFKVIPILGTLVSFISILIGVGTIISLCNRKR